MPLVPYVEEADATGIVKSAALSSASANAMTVGWRSAGALARALRSSRSNAGGRSSDSAGGSSIRCAISRLCSESRWYGRPPVTIW